jgi:hypothetical protein
MRLAFDFPAACQRFALPLLVVLFLIPVAAAKPQSARRSSAKAVEESPPAAESNEDSAEPTAPKESTKKPGKPAAKAADKDAIPRNVQRTILQHMKGKKAELRVDAVRELAEYPSVEAARMLVQHGLASKYEEVRKAAYETLLDLRDNQEVGEFLLDSVKKDTTKGTARETTCAMLAVALASDLEPVQKQAGEVLAKTAKQPKGGLLLLVTLADELGRLGDQTSLSTLVKLTKQPLFEEEFAFRRSIVQALTQVQEVEAVDALIEVLGKAKGEVRADISRYLTSISGEQHEVDAKAWAEWWQANKQDFDFPPRGARAAARAKPGRANSMYYGLPIYAQRLVFVIDASLSMRGARIEAAKRELINAINGLPEGVYFDVLAFHVEVIPWQRKLAIASQQNKQLATNFVQSLDLGRATASYDALEAALDFDTESIYFLTDGAPRGGKVDDPFQIVEVLTRLNHTRRVTINSIGIGVGPEGNPFDEFLKTLAAQNYGDYRRVDE